MFGNSVNALDNVCPDFARAHVLIVDDEEVNRFFLREVCSKLGIGNIDEAKDGYEAFELITRFRPDLILLDINMPRMNGFEFMRRMQYGRLHEGITILVHTDFQETDDRVRCFNFGATDVISRPFQTDELKARIWAHLRSSIASRVLFDFRRRIQSHIDITRSFLASILPTAANVEDATRKYGLECSALYKPHDEIGGDLWLLRPLDDEQLSIILIDASAHGLAGAINALRVDCLVQEYHDYLYDPGTFLTKLDTAMAKISFGQLFAGAVALTYHRTSGIVRYAGSNIPSPLLKSNGSVAEFKTKGLPLGSGIVRAATSTAILQPGATLVLSSDGWLDGDSSKTSKTLAGTDSFSPDLAKAMATEGPFSDDLTLIVLHRS